MFIAPSYFGAMPWILPYFDWRRRTQDAHDYLTHKHPPFNPSWRNDDGMHLLTSSWQKRIQNQLMANPHQTSDVSRLGLLSGECDILVSYPMGFASVS